MKLKFLLRSATIAGIYIVLTLISSLFGLSSGMIQLRLSEALCVLPALTSAAVPGLFVGCLISNIITGCLLPDVFFGAFATLAGAVGTYLLREIRYIRFLPPVIANVIVVPLLLKFAYGLNANFALLALYVFVGEALSVYVIGGAVYKLLNKRARFLFK